ncbi:MAG TPA: MFS transporter [Acetobacteraceae bacterium]|nr:MFS transporter [Acetobacteraceae bacterium]
MISKPGVARRHGWYHGWNIVAVAILAQIAGNGLTVNAFSLFLHDWAAALGTKISTLQLGLAAMGLGSALLSPLAGVAADKYPARLLFGVGLAGMALFHIGISFVTATWQFLTLFGLVLPGALVVSTMLTANALVSRWFVRRLGLALGLTAFGLGAAGAILPPIIAAAMPALGWRMVWRIAGVIIACIILPAALMVMRDRPTERDGLDYLTGKREAVPHSRGEPSRVRWRDILRRRSFWLLLLAYLPMLALYGGCAQNLEPIVTSRGLSQLTAGALLSALSVSQVASTLLMGMLSDRFGNKLPLLGLALATGIGGLIVAFGQGIASLGIGFVLVGLSSGLWPLLAAAVAAEFGANAVGRAFGLLTLFIPVIALAPFVIAKTHEATGSYTPGLTGLAVLAGLGACACLFMRERHRGRDDDAGNAPALNEAVAPIC